MTRKLAFDGLERVLRLRFTGDHLLVRVGEPVVQARARIPVLEGGSRFI